MKKSILFLLIALPLMMTVVTRASGPIGVYAIVEKVTLEPNDSTPERAQVWGAFSVKSERGGNTYGPAQRGYLYYKIDTSMCGGRSPKTCVSDVEKQTRSLWNDLKKKAVTREAVGFGGGFGDNASVKVRKATDKPGSPDPFSLANPLVVLGSSQADITAKLKAALQ